MPLSFSALILTAALTSRVRAVLPTGTPSWLQFNSGVNELLAPSPNEVPNFTRLWRVRLPEVADGSPAYVGGITTAGDNRLHDLLIVSTMAGRTVAIDAHTGATVWQTVQPPGTRWTTSSPAIDPQREFVYTYALDGYVHKYALNSGAEVEDDSWPELVTLKGDVEKGSSALSIATAKNGRTYLYAVTAGYPDPGDAGDYQGHLVTIDLASGAQAIFNAACSDKLFHFVENGSSDNDCSNVQAGIWGRSGAVYDPATDRVFISTGNGVYDANAGGFDWGDSVIALTPDGVSDGGTPVDSYTPSNYQWMADNDFDLGSTAVAILPLPPDSDLNLGVQGGKDWSLRLLNLRDLSGSAGPRHVGGELNIVKVPQGGEVHTRPATWRDRNDVVWVAVATDLGVSALTLDLSGSTPNLVPRWSISDRGTSPIFANDVLYFAHDHEIVAVDPSTGRRIWADGTIGTIHWQSPIVVENALYLEDGDGNLSAFGLP